MPPVGGSALGGGGGGGGGAACATGAIIFGGGGGGGGAIIFGGGGGGGGGGLQLPLAVTPPAVASGHGPPLACAPPALASGGICAKAGVPTTSAVSTTAAIVKSKITRLKYATSFHLAQPPFRGCFTQMANISNLGVLRNNCFIKNHNILGIFNEEHTAFCVCGA